MFSYFIFLSLPKLALFSQSLTINQHISPWLATWTCLNEPCYGILACLVFCSSFFCVFTVKNRLTHLDSASFYDCESAIELWCKWLFYISVCGAKWICITAAQTQFSFMPLTLIIARASAAIDIFHILWIINLCDRPPFHKKCWWFFLFSLFIIIFCQNH